MLLDHGRILLHKSCSGVIKFQDAPKNQSFIHSSRSRFSEPPINLFTNERLCYGLWVRMLLDHGEISLHKSSFGVIKFQDAPKNQSFIHYGQISRKKSWLYLFFSKIFENLKFSTKKHQNFEKICFLNIDFLKNDLYRAKIGNFRKITKNPIFSVK